MMQENPGLLRVYGERESGLLLGAEMVAPAGEHLAHLLSWVIQKEMTVFEVHTVCCPNVGSIAQ